MSFDIYLRNMEKTASMRDHAEILALRSALGSAVGGANAMRGKYKGNRGEGFVRGLGGFLGSMYGGDIAGRAGMHSAKAMNMSPMGRLGGAALGVTTGAVGGAHLGSRTAGALYNKLRGKKKEEEKKDV